MHRNIFAYLAIARSERETVYFFPLFGFFCGTKPPQSWKQPVPKCRNLSGCVQRHEQGTSADMESTHTHEVTVGMCHQAEMLLKMQGWNTEIKLKLVRDIGKERKGSLKYKINIREVEKGVGPEMRGHMRFSDKDGVKVRSVFHSIYMESRDTGFHVPGTKVVTWDNFIKLFIYLTWVVKCSPKDPVRLHC